MTWPAIHADILQPRCGDSECHDSENPINALDWVSGGSQASLTRAVDADPQGVLCQAGPPIITASDSAQSLLYLKLLDGACGSRMPLARDPLTDQQQCVIREWIDCGACPEADGGACASCLETARTTCGVTVSAGTVSCTAVPASCPSRI